MTPIPLLLLSILALAHAIGDFVLQTESIVVGKQSSLRILGWHVVQHVLTMAALLVLGGSRLHFAAPGAFPSATETAILVLGIGLVHFLADRSKILALARWGHPTRWFLLDQTIHLFTLWAGVRWLIHQHPEWTILSMHPIYVLGQPHPIEGVGRATLVVAAALLATRGGALLAWIASRDLRNATPDQAWVAAGLPVHTLRDQARLARGYGIRLGLLLAVVSLPWWLALIGLAGFATWRLRALQQMPDLVQQFGRRGFAVDLGSAAVLGGLVRVLAG